MNARSLSRHALLVSLAVLGISVLSQGAATAAITTYTSEASFTPNLQAGYYLEDFSSASTAGATTMTFSGPSPANTFSYVIGASDSGGVVGVPTDFQKNSTSQGRALSTFTEGVGLVINFTGANVTAVGGNFFWTDNSSPTAAVVAGDVHAQLNDGTSVDISSSANNSVGFGGFTSDGAAITSLTLSLKNYSSGFYYPTLDNFYVGQVSAVPEAGAWWAAGFLGLLLVGRSGFAFLKRRQASQAP